ncbi:MAG TPA: hypothetical protein VFG47_20625 [Geminicoccaceae bacterium]|nr:hypothetical protein [Geminicoccaceae bacterium]
MSAFAADWLGLREPFDAAARSAALAAGFAAALPPAPRVIDLGSGTGSNLRYLAPRLGGPQAWLLTDHDGALLDAVPPTTRRFATARGWTLREGCGALRLDAPSGPVRVRRHRLDLARELNAVPFDEADAVTGSALLDLTSAAWLDALAARCAAARLPVLFALTYDGPVAWRPAADGDARVKAAFDAHQAGDKGFGPALGRDAALYLAGALQAAGFAVRLDRSDWRIGSGDPAMLLAMVEGVALAAREAMEPDAVDAWAARRRAEAERGGLELRVGHVDLLALPPG